MLVVGFALVLPKVQLDIVQQRAHVYENRGFVEKGLMRSAKQVGRRRPAFRPQTCWRQGQLFLQMGCFRAGTELWA